MNELLQVEVGKDQKCTLSEWIDQLLKWISESKSESISRQNSAVISGEGLENQE